MRQYRQQFKDFFAWTFVGERAETFMRIAFTMTFDLNLGIAKLSLLITLCASYLHSLLELSASLLENA